MLYTTQPQLPVHTATINGQVYGCGIDDDVEMCADLHGMFRRWNILMLVPELMEVAVYSGR